MPPPPPAPLIGDVGIPAVDALGDVLNTKVDPFLSAPDPTKGTLGAVAQGVNGVLGLLSTPVELLDTGLAMATSSLTTVGVGSPAARMYAMHLGIPHIHFPPGMPLPSMGPVMAAGCQSVIIMGAPAARASDVGLAPLCLGKGPVFEIFTGSSNTFIGGSRAARAQIDITRHCFPSFSSLMKGAGAAKAAEAAKKGSAMGMALSAVGLGASALNLAATGLADPNAVETGPVPDDAEQAKLQAEEQAREVAANTAAQAAEVGSQIAQLAADALALPMSMLLGKDPGVPPSIGMLLDGAPTVLIGGFPVPDLTDLASGLVKKGMQTIRKALRKPKFAKGRQVKSNTGECNSPGHPIYPGTGAVYDRYVDFEDPTTDFVWSRHYRSNLSEEDGPLGCGMRLFLDRRLRLLRTRALYETHENEVFELLRDDADGFITSSGIRLQRLSPRRYLLWQRDAELEFETLERDPERTRLIRFHEGKLELTLQYDRQGRLSALWQLTKQGSCALRVEYDAHDHVTCVKRALNDEEARAIARYGYEDGCLVSVHDALGNQSRFAYDGGRRLIRQTDRRGYSFHYEYDDLGRCIKSYGDDGLWPVEGKYGGSHAEFRDSSGTWLFKNYPDGALSHLVDPLGGIEQYVRDERGQIARQIMPGGAVYEWLYDREGRHLGRLDPWLAFLPPQDEVPNPPNPRAHNGPTTPRDIHCGRPLWTLTASRLELPERIRLSLSWLGTPTAADAPKPEPRYDPLGRVIEQPHADGTAEFFERDPEGNVVAYRDRSGHVHQSTISSWNLVTAKTRPEGGTTHYAYTPEEKVRSVVDANGNATDYVYDARRRLTEVHRHGKLLHRYAYDAHDALAERLDADGAWVLRCTSNDKGLHATCELASGEQYRYTYDAHGSITEASSREHQVRQRHDLLRRRVRDERDGVGVQHAYGAKHLAVTRYLARYEVQYEAGQLGVWQVRTPDGSEHRFSRTSEGDVLRQNGNGSYELSHFDADQRLTGRMVWRRGNLETGPTWLVQYTYRGQDELASSFEQDRGTTHYRYDRDGRLIQQSRADRHWHYGYDRGGNLTTLPALGAVQYKAGNLVVGTEREQFEYDAQYRLARHRRNGVETRYTYDGLGQLTTVMWSDRAEVWRAAYDGLGRRIWREYGDERTDFYWDGDRLAAERAPSGALRLYVYVNEDALVPFMLLDYASEESRAEDGRAYWLYTAPNGMPLRVEDRMRRVVWAPEAVDAYGAVELAGAQGIALRLRFAGHFEDEFTGLFYNRFRDYDPRLGRYLQPDPIGIEGGVNLYAYVANPLVHVDLRGLECPEKPKKGEGQSETAAAKGNEKPPKKAGADNDAEPAAVSKRKREPDPRAELDEDIEPGLSLQESSRRMDAEIRAAVKRAEAREPEVQARRNERQQKIDSKREQLRTESDKKHKGKLQQELAQLNSQQKEDPASSGKVFEGAYDPVSGQLVVARSGRPGPHTGLKLPAKVQGSKTTPGMCAMNGAAGIVGDRRKADGLEPDAAPIHISNGGYSFHGREAGDDHASSPYSQRTACENCQETASPELNPHLQPGPLPEVARANPEVTDGAERPHFGKPNVQTDLSEL